MILLIISFVAGVLTVLAPCILPLLPVIVGGSLTGEEKGVQVRKVFTIVISLGLSVIAFTLLLKASTLFIVIPEYVWKWISGGIIIILGLITVFPSLWESKIMARLSAKSNILLGKGAQKGNFWGDVIVGSALGPVFSTCSPTYFIVLATVLPVQPIVGLAYLLAYAVGLSLSLFIIAFIGQKIMSKLNIAADPKGWFKKTLGVLFLLVGIAIISGVDKKIETAILDAGLFDITKIEQKLLELSEEEKDNVEDDTQEDIDLESGANVENKEAMEKTDKINFLSIAEKNRKYKLAPELVSPDGFINTEGKPITLAELRGKKVVLLDIWTYSCINCQRTLPYINDWYAKYKDQGLEIVGVHTPEFAFEKKYENVQDATEKFGVKYPVVLDNNYQTWNALGNRYWPRKYLIDIDGYIIYNHIGEGEYENTEKMIQKALAERNAKLGILSDMPKETSSPENIISVNPSKVGSPEIYFGSSRNERLANGRPRVSGEQTFTLPPSILLNGLYLDGNWDITPEYSESKGVSKIVFKYIAKNVYFVAGSEDGVEVEIYNDGKLIKNATIRDEGLYNLVENADYGEHLLEIRIKDAGLQAFTFTFG